MLASIAGALNKHSVALAQIATLQLMFPDPPFVSNARPSRDIIVKFIRALNSSGLIKEGWDAGLHPRWPTGAPDGQGGRFAPKNELVGPDGFAEDTPRTKPAGMPEGLVQVAARGNEACATALVGAVGMCAATAGATVACPETGVSVPLCQRPVRGVSRGRRWQWKYAGHRVMKHPKNARSEKSVARRTSERFSHMQSTRKSIWKG